MWFKKNKWTVILPILILGVLAAAFYFGGNAPGSSGWGANDPVSAAWGETEQVSPAAVGKARLAKTESVEPAEMGEAAEDAPAETAEASEPTMEIDSETGQDQYHTDPVPEGQPLPVEPQDTQIGTAYYTCTLSISCATILNNMDMCDLEKIDLVPQDGWILQPTSVTFLEGESVFDVLLYTCMQMNIHMEYTNTPIYNSAYIEGIHNLYEFDVGELSGWMYSVNGWFPNYGCSRYQLKDGDVINWVYTCDLGYDVGGGYAAGN